MLGWCYRAKGWGMTQLTYVVVQRSGLREFLPYVGFEDWLTDPRFNTANARDEHKTEVYQRVEAYTMQFDKYTLTKELGAKGVPVGPVLDWYELGKTILI
ncbi:MAG: CoA transferase [Bifidobacterium adolescentis]